MNNDNVAAGNNDGNERIRDNTDIGPVPLQKGTAPNGDFKGVYSCINDTTVRTTNMVLDTFVTKAVIQKYIDRSNVADDNQEKSVDTEDNTEIFKQTDILPSDGFVNMHENHYAWACTFLPVFVPEYTSIEGKIKWLILNDIDG